MPLKIGIDQLRGALKIYYIEVTKGNSVMLRETWSRYGCTLYS